MALYEFYCEPCQHRFEQITSSTDPDRGKCPKCNANKTRKLISRFAVGGQGDLRESTWHGCHEHYTGMPHSHSHAEDHSHGPHGHGDKESG